MKKLLIMAIIMISPSVFAELKLNTSTGMYYSQGAKKDVNQAEYNNIVVYIIQYAQAANPGKNIDMGVFAALRVIGTPAAKRLIHDLQKLLKATKGDLKTFYGN